MRQLLFISFTCTASANILQPRFTNNTASSTVTPTSTSSASPQQNVNINSATSTSSFPSGTTTGGSSSSSSRSTSILLHPTVPPLSCTTSCEVGYPPMSSIFWSPVEFDATTTSNYTAATWVTYVDSLHNLTSSTLVRASTTPAGVFNQTQVATLTLLVGQHVTSTALLTYPSNYIAYDPDYNVYGIWPTLTVYLNYTPPVTTSVCENFTDGTYIFPTSHPVFPAPPAPTPDPSDPLGLDYSAKWEIINTPSYSFFKSEFSDQFPYASCNPQPITTFSSISEASPSTKTSVAVLTAQTIIATNLAQAAQSIGSGGGNPGGSGSVSSGNRGDDSSGDNVSSGSGNSGGSNGNSGPSGGNSDGNGGSSNSGSGGNSQGDGSSNGGSSSGSSNEGSSNSGSSNGGSSNGGSSNGGSSNGGSSGSSSNSGSGSSSSGGLGSVILSALNFGGSGPAATPQAQSNGNSGSSNAGSGSGSGAPNNGGAQPAGAGAPAGAQSVAIGGNTVLAIPTTAANGAPAVVIGGQTKTIGQTLTFMGTPVVVSGSSSSPELIIGGNANTPAQTIALATPAPGSNGGNAVATTVNGQPAVVVGGITATVGQSVTIGGQVGQVVTSGSVTEIVFPGSGGSSPSTSIVGAAGAGSGTSQSTPGISTVAAPVATLNAVPTTISGKPEVVIGGSITASIGQVVTISGTPVLVTTSGSSTELIFGGTSTSIVPKPTSTSGASSIGRGYRWLGALLASFALALGLILW